MNETGMSVKAMQWAILVLLGGVSASVGLPALNGGSSLDASLLREQLRIETTQMINQAIALEREYLLHAIEIHHLRGHERMPASRFIEKMPQ